jgi:hypothetical protein
MSFKTYLEKSMSKTSKDGLVSILIYFTKERLRNKYIDIYIYIYSSNTILWNMVTSPRFRIGTLVPFFLTTSSLTNKETYSYGSSKLLITQEKNIPAVFLSPSPLV